MELELAGLSEEDNLNMHDGERIILRLTYISRYNTSNANIEVARILEQAQRNNERKGITGVLVINENYFLQSIEGARPIINELLRELVKDDRHFSLQVIECREVEQRRWNKWSMKYLTLGDQDIEYVLKFSAGTDFNPYLMSTSQIMMFIDTLSELQGQREKYAFEMKKS
ncbi:BLUF domain-containing protein [Psychrobacter urativorans]|uniref:BLUF domain-containing protein n=1 Tax=Psychrobacter urativorans TaxID=45610 RepID=UPI00191950EE|nr:BLUF domain-containing protein [Psychrobacter urativorans]